MPVAPTGILSLPTHVLINMLCASATWQAWCSVASAAAARDHVFIGELDRAGAPTPWAIVDMDRDWSLGRVGTHAYRPGGVLLLLVTAQVPTQYAANWGDAQTDFLNQLGAVIADIGDQASQPGAIDFDRIETLGPTRTAKHLRAKEGDWFQAALFLQFGGDR